jgi:hypothetical protein
LRTATYRAKFPRVANPFALPTRQCCSRASGQKLSCYAVARQSITCDSNFVCVAADEVYTFPLVNGSVLFPPLTNHVGGMRFDRTSSICVSHEGFNVYANFRETLTIRAILSRESLFPRADAKPGDFGYVCSDGVTNVHFNARDRTATVYHLNVRPIRTVTLEKGDCPLNRSFPHLIPDFRTTDVSIMSNGAFLIFLLPAQNRTVCRSFSLLTGKHAGDTECEAAEFITATYDSINQCVWGVVREDGGLWVRQFAARLPLNSFILGADVPESPRSNAERLMLFLMHYIGSPIVPPPFRLERQILESLMNGLTASAPRPSVQPPLIKLVIANLTAILSRGDLPESTRGLFPEFLDSLAMPPGLLARTLWFESLVSEDWFLANFYGHLSGATNDSQSAWAYRFVEQRFWRLPDWDAAVTICELPLLPAADQQPDLVASALSLQVGLAVRALSYIEQNAEKYLPAPNPSPLSSFCALIAGSVRKVGSLLRTVADGDHFEGNVIIPFLLVQNLMHLLPAFLDVLSVSNELLQSLPGLAEMLRKCVDEIMSPVFVHLVRYVPFVLANFIASAIQGAEASCLERRFRWLVRQGNFDRVMSEMIPASTMELIYESWRPQLHRNLRPNLKELDRWALTALTAHLNGEMTPSALRAMVQIRNFARARYQQGQTIDFVLAKLQLLFEANSEFEEGDDVCEKVVQFIEHPITKDHIIKLVQGQENRVQLTMLGLESIEKGLESKIPCYSFSQISHFDALKFVCDSVLEHAERISNFIEEFVISLLGREIDSALSLFVFRLLRDCGCPELNSRLLERMIDLIENDQIFAICCLLARTCQIIPQHDFQERHLIIFTIFAMEHEIDFEFALQFYENLPKTSRRVFGCALSHQFALSQSVDDIQRFIGHEGHKFAEFEVADCSIAIVRRALKSSHFLRKLLEGLIKEGPFESKSFALAACGGLIPGDKDYRKIRRDFDEGVLLDDKICVLPVTNDPKLQNFDAKSGFIVLPEVAIAVDAFPANEIISAVFDEVLGQLARPLGYLAVQVFRLAGLSLADKNINWPKTLVPYEDYSQTFRQLRALHELKLFELEIPKFIGIQFSTKFALISSEIIGNCEFNVISSEEIEVGIVPNGSRHNSSCTDGPVH